MLFCLKFYELKLFTEILNLIKVQMVAERSVICKIYGNIN